MNPEKQLKPVRFKFMPETVIRTS